MAPFTRPPARTAPSPIRRRSSRPPRSTGLRRGAAPRLDRGRLPAPNVLGRLLAAPRPRPRSFGNAFPRAFLFVCVPLSAGRCPAAHTARCGRPSARLLPAPPRGGGPAQAGRGAASRFQHLLHLSPRRPPAPPHGGGPRPALRSARAGREAARPSFGGGAAVAGRAGRLPHPPPHGLPAERRAAAANRSAGSARGGWAVPADGPMGMALPEQRRRRRGEVAEGAVGGAGVWEAEGMAVTGEVMLGA